MPSLVGIPATAYLSTAEHCIDTAIENDASADSVLAQETVEPGTQRHAAANSRDRPQVGEVRAVMAISRANDMADSMFRGKTQKDMVAQIERQLEDRQDHRRQMAATRQPASLAESRAVFESVAVAQQIKPLTTQLNQLTKALTEKLRPDRGAHALEQLNQATADPVARFAVMQLARATLIDGGFADEAAQLDEAISKAYETHGEEIRAVSNTAASAATMFKTHEERDKFRLFYVQTLSADLTPRYLFDGLLEIGGVGNLNLTASTMASALGDDMLAVRTSVPRDQLERLYSYLSLFHRTQVARTMLANARDLLESQAKLEGLDDAKRNAKSVELCRELLAVGYASLPAPILERIIKNLADRSDQSHSKVLNSLYKAIPSWPNLVWASAEVRDGAVRHVLKRLDQAFESNKRKQFFGSHKQEEFFGTSFSKRHPLGQPA